jgi:uncharacterized membrane protein YoaT (DUF817 family)
MVAAVVLQFIALKYKKPEEEDGRQEHYLIITHHLNFMLELLKLDNDTYLYPHLPLQN